MAIKDIIILGAGPCGLSTAIALAKITPTPRITIIELRPKPQPMGGTINMTPLAIRYLDYLGAGQRLRDRSIALVDGVDMISLRTGWRMGNLWGGIGCRRTARFSLVESLLETVKKEHANTIEIQWGRRVTGIDEVDDKVVLAFDDRSTTRGDVLLGCDGIHSAARSLWVEPGRDKIYSGRAVTMGWYNTAPRKDEELKQTAAPITYLGGQPAIRDTAVFNGHGGVLITSYFEPTRQNIFFAHVREMDEPTAAGRDGWQVLGKDQHAVRQEVVRTYEGGRVNGLEAAISGCDSWHQYPIYKLPPGGRWHRGRVLLLGDAAHAMPPQGESTGISIEDGVLIAEIFRRRESRSVEQLFSDHEAVRRDVIDKHYRDAEFFGKLSFKKTSGVFAYLWEFVTAFFMLLKKLQQVDHFKGDVRNLKLPA